MPRAGIGPVRVIDGRFLIVVFVVPIRTPLTRVAVHVIQAKGVRRFLPTACVVRPELPEYQTVVSNRSEVVAKMIPRRRSRPAGIFPFRFRGKPVALLLFPAEPVGRRRGIVPTHAHHRVFIALLEARITPRVLRLEVELARRRVDARAPLFSPFSASVW